VVTKWAEDQDMTDWIRPEQFHATEGVEDWRMLAEGACTTFRVGSFAEAARLVGAIGALAGFEDHQPDVDIRAGAVTVRLITTTDEIFAVTERDVELARGISAAAQDLGIAADPTATQTVMAIVETIVPAEVMPFWRAVLGYEPRPDSPDEDLVDPRGRGPAFWFETVGAYRPKGNGIHIAVWVPHDQAEARVEAALAAGGHMVRDEFAPAWWTLADDLGNEADVATTMGRN
jgi:4a-hydroxytetrahydrobiopterin dehydratase